MDLRRGHRLRQLSIEWNGPPISDEIPVSIDEVRASLNRVFGQDLPPTCIPRSARPGSTSDCRTRQTSVGNWRPGARLGVTAHAPAARPADALLVRPDGYVAWASGANGTDNLVDALTTWFGDPSPGVPENAWR